MAWLLDTKAWIQILKQPAGRLEQELLSRPPSEIVLCAIVTVELWQGANKYARRNRRLAALDKLFAPFVSFPFDDDAARQYADIRHHLEQAGIVVWHQTALMPLTTARGKARARRLRASRVPRKPRPAILFRLLESTLFARFVSAP